MDRKDAQEQPQPRAIERRPGSQIEAPPLSWRTQASSVLTDPFSAGLPLHDYIRILRKHRWMILIVVAVMVTVVAVVSFRMSPVYQATARLELNGETPDLASLQALYATLPTLPEFLETQVRILQSDELAMQTIRALRLHEKPEFAVRAPHTPEGTPFTPAEETKLINIFRSRLTVQLIRSSRLVETRFESNDPRLAADIINKLSDLYIENNYRKKYESTLQAQQYMSTQLLELRDKMERSHEAMIAYERDKQIFAVSEGQNAVSQKLGDLMKELTNAEADRIQKESLFQLVKTRKLEDLPGFNNNLLVVELQKRVESLQDELAELRITFGPKYPKVQKLEQQLESVRGQLQKERESVANRIEGEYQAALRREQLLRKAVEAQKVESNSMNERLVEYSVLKREYETNQQLYEGLLSRLKEAAVTQGMRANNISVVDRARPPLTPIRPRKTINILLSLVVGLVVGGVLAIFNEYLDNSVKVPEEIENLIGLPALGVIPAVESISATSRRSYGLTNGRSSAQSLVPAAGMQSLELPTVSQPHSVVAEAYRALRTSILLSTSKHPPQTILITSGQPREGKTTTALNLAIALAQRGDRVVLIDSDLRRPRVHRSFGLSNDTGLSSFLAGAAAIDDLPRPVPHIPKLFVIPSGPTPPNPAELLSSEPMEALYRELRRQFDFIVLDSPPAITVADSMILAAHADGVIIVVHGGVTTRESLRQAHKLMASVKARLIGVVLNNVDIRSADYQYYYTYYYGDYYRHMLEGYGYGYEDHAEAGQAKVGKQAGA